MKNMKKLIIFLIITIGIYIIGSVYYPRPFIRNNDDISPNVKIELQNFSLINPKFIGFQYDDGYSRYNVFNLELNRNWYLGWNLDSSKIEQKIV
jgi:hypothetical protein